MPDPLFTALAEELMADPQVVRGKVFGRDALKVAGKMFAAEIDGELLIKLSAERREELLAAGARPFQPMGRRPMGDWIVVPVPDAGDPFERWLALADESREHVAAGA